MFTRDESLETDNDKEKFIGKIFETTKDGNFIVFGVHDKKGRNKRYIVEFLNNGHQQLTYKPQILTGNVKNNSLQNPKIGRICKTNRCGECVILEIFSGKKIKGEKETRQTARIRFLDTGYEGIFMLNNIERGEIQDPYAKTFFGVGFLGELSFNPKDNLEIYSRWHDILERVYDKGGHINYKDVSVCDRWHCLENFYEDFKELRGYENFQNNPDTRFDIDKDIFGEGKLYSKEECVLIPHDVNMLFAFEQCNNTSGFPGVSYEKGRGAYQVGLSKNGVRKWVGRFSSPVDGYKAYVEAKLEYCDEILSQYDFIEEFVKIKIKNNLEKQLMEVLNV